MMSAAISLEHIDKSFELIREKHSSLKAALLSFRRSRPQRVPELQRGVLQPADLLPD